MPESDRSLLAPAIFGLIVVSAGVGAWLGSTSQGQQYQNHRDTRVDGVVAVKNFAQGADSEQRRGNHQNDKSELNAQWLAAHAAEDSAFWAKWSFWVATLGAAALITTIVQGRVALRRAREANKIALETLQAENRPWLDVTVRIDPEKAFEWKADETYGFGAYIGVRHHGSAPAKNVYVSIRTTCADDCRNAADLFLKQLKARRGWALARAVFPNEPVPETRYGCGISAGDNFLAEHGMVHPTLLVGVSYLSAWEAENAEPHVTIRAVKITNGAGITLMEKDCPIPGNELVMTLASEYPGYTD